MRLLVSAFAAIALLPASPALQVFAQLAAKSSTTASMPSFSTPALSPDGRELAFASGGDIWTAPAGGGEAHLLISDPAEESRPLYSPDGARLAFQSTRTGANDIYVLTFATGKLDRITYTDAPVTLDSWSRDGQWLLFTSSANDIAGQGDIFRVRSTGGTPLELSAERYLNEFESTPSPDGKSIVLVAKGISNSQWWRKGHSHIDETELWLKPLDSAGGYRMLLPADSKHAWPMFSPDGRSILFVGDSSGAENIWQMDAAPGAKPRQITKFSNGRCLWPTLSGDGKQIVFERGFSIWKLDLASGKSAEISLSLRGVPSTPGVVHTRLASWTDLALSPDGTKIAMASHGDIFAASARDGGEPQRITSTPAVERSVQWSPDSTKLVYLSERDGGASLYLYDFPTNKEAPLTASAAIDGSPSWSPDGKSIAYLRDRKELHVLALAGLNKTADKVIARGETDSYGSASVAWSPDGHWVVFVLNGVDGFANLYAVPADGSAPARPITFLANGQTASHLAWSPDGKYILFDTAQRSEMEQLARVDLIPHVPSYREDQFRDLFRKQSTPGSPDSLTDRTRGPQPQEAPATTESAPPAQTSTPSPAEALATPARPAAAKKPAEPTKIVFEGIRERLTIVPVGLPIRFPVISPDGKTLAFLAEVAGLSNVYTYSLDELSREPAAARQLTSTPANKNNLAWTPNSRELYFLEGGPGRGGDAPGGAPPPDAGVRAVSLETRLPRTIALSAAVDVDFDEEKMVVFDEAWTTLDHRFWEPNFNGANWPALRDEWRPYIAGARTGPELRRDINLLIGEMNSSHSGIAKPAPPAVRTGRLGLRFERLPYESGGNLIVREIVPLGPAALATFDTPGSAPPIKVGDRIVAVNATPITASTNLDRLLEDKAGKRTVLSVESAGKRFDAVVRPVPLQVESGLFYRAWVESRRAYVEKISGGKLGYVHIAAMGDSDLSQLYLDLDAANQEKKGVVVDVRNNNGGYVNGRVIDVFSRRNYLMMTPRDSATVPSRQALGQRALGLPTVLVTNESTLSDGEDFTEGYRALGLGKVVGVPTAGWIVFTGSQRLIDGSQVRVPGERIKDTRGEDMEMHPRPVDVLVERALGETETGSDAQLQKAVETLLGQVK